MAGSLRSWFAAAPHVPRLPADEAARLYPGYRLRVLEATFLGYAMFYLVRNPVSPVMKDMQAALQYDDLMVGNIMAATSIAYGIGKFFMGSLSDRCNPRAFMAVGLLLTAVCNFAFGASRNYNVHVAIWAMNGLFQGMGWPPCGRSMGHWFSERERGLTFSIWNTSHNVGGGIAGALAAYAAGAFGGWQYALFVPGLVAAAGSAYLFLRLVDTPQSVGLPPVEEYKNDFTEEERREGLHEQELSFRERLLDHVLKNPYVWILAIANFFAYITRYGMLTWGPKYLAEVKGASTQSGGWAQLALEFGGIPSTILLGWLSDRLGGRRGRVSVLCMILILPVFAAIPFVPGGSLWMDNVLLVLVGFFIYPVINLIVVQALDITSKKAIGTAAGFIGLFGYMGQTAMNTTFGWILKNYKPVYGVEGAWNIVIKTILGCTVLAVLLLLPMWRMRPKA